LEQAVLALEEHLQKSIAERVLASDVEVGVFLSGGIDSNLVVAMASQVRPRLKTFTVKFNGLYDESPLARLTAEKYHTEHIELSVSASLQDDTEKILLAYGEPFMDSSAIPSYYVSREAAKYVKVVLNGDGADELFGGYRRYVPMVHSLTKYIGLISPVIKVLPKPHTKQSLYNYIYRLISMMHKQGLDFYLSATSDVYEDVYTINDGSILLELSQFIEKVFANKKLSSLSKMLYLDFNLLLFCDLLVKIDIATMANSLEGRSPFLSKYLLEFTPLLPDRYKVRGLHTKFILRALAKKYLPAALIYQPKRGFEVPLRKWIDEDLRTPIFDYLKPGCYSETFIKPKFIQALLEKKVNISAEKRAKILWGLFCLEVWHAHE
jgi:asparagine synthase (glutamine-hydrolysing)